MLLNLIILIYIYILSNKIIKLIKNNKRDTILLLFSGSILQSIALYIDLLLYIILIFTMKKLNIRIEL